LWLAACGPKVRAVDVAPSLSSCLMGAAVNEVQVTGLGDFPPAAGGAASATSLGSASLALPDGTRVVEVDGRGPAGLAAFGRTPPLDLAHLYGSRIAVAYGPRDGLCATGKLNFARAGHRATTLADGSVLISGGVDAEGFAVPRLELYSALDDASGAAATFRIVDLGGPTALDARAALGQAVTPLPDGGALVTGGAPSQNGKAQGIAFEGFTRHGADGKLVGAPQLLGGGPRAFHTATLISDGRVLIAGGCQQLVGGDCLSGSALDTTQIYDPTTDTFSDGPRLLHARWGHSAVSTGSGGVLLSGGLSDGGAVERLDQVFLTARHDTDLVFDAGAGGGSAAVVFTGAVALVDARAGAVDLWSNVDGSSLALPTLAPPDPAAEAVALEDGGFLVAGGNQPLVVYDGRGTPSALAPYPRQRFAAARVGDGSVLLTGGASDGTASTDAFVYLRSPVGPWVNLPTLTFDSPNEPFLPRRPDRAVVAGGRLRIRTGGSEPGLIEFALAAGMIVGDFTLDVAVGLGAAGDQAVLLLGRQPDGSATVVTVGQGAPVGVWTAGSPDASCAGVAPSAGELPVGDVAPVRVSWRRGRLTVGTPSRSFVDCRPSAPIARGSLGLGASVGTAYFDNWAITR